jgi:hypothetical protein
MGAHQACIVRLFCICVHMYQALLRAAVFGGLWLLRARRDTGDSRDLGSCISACLVWPFQQGQYRTRYQHASSEYRARYQRVCGAGRDSLWLWPCACPSYHNDWPASVGHVHHKRAHLATKRNYGC